MRAGLVVRIAVGAALDVNFADARDADKALVFRDLDGAGMTFSFGLLGVDSWAFLGGEGG